DLVNEPWTWASPGTLTDKLIVEAFRATGIEPPRARIYGDAINMRLKLVASGRFLAVVPLSVLKFQGKLTTIKILPVELPTTNRTTGIIVLKNRTLSPLAQIFIESALEIAQTLSKGRL